MFNKNPHYTIIDKCLIKHVGGMVFNATFNNILVISWQSVLLVEETGVPGENHWPCLSSTPAMSGI